MKSRFVLISSVFAFLTSAAFAGPSPPVPFKSGEKVTYSIKKVGVKAGEASLLIEGPVSVEGRDVFVITFTASALNFFDEEKITMDPQSYLPLRVQRDLNIWGRREKITEEYFQDQGIVRIKKIAGGKETTQTIKKKGTLDNIYCFIYRYRKQGRFNIGETLTMNLPTRNVKIALASQGRIAAGGKKYQAFFLQSLPKQYRMWFDTGERKIPLRIDGSMGIAGTSLIMSGFEPGK